MAQAKTPAGMLIPIGIEHHGHIAEPAASSLLSFFSILIEGCTHEF
jgi:hypothetical protein